MDCTFVVGQRVVCARIKIHEGWVCRGETLPQVGQTYTIREIEMGYNVPHLRFKELINPVLKYDNGLMECFFPYKCFKPLVEKEIDISIFTKMLKPRSVLELI